MVVFVCQTGCASSIGWEDSSELLSRDGMADLFGTASKLHVITAVIHVYV